MRGSHYMFGGVALPSIQSREFGLLTFDSTDVYLFPEGLHGFEDSREYLLMEREGLAPFCFLQSVTDGALRFICLPTQIIDAGFVVDLGMDDANDLELAAGSYGSADSGVCILAILTIPPEGPATANLFAPIVLATATRRGRQCIQFGTAAPTAQTIPWMVRSDPQAVA